MWRNCNKTTLFEQYFSHETYSQIKFDKILTKIRNYNG